MDEEKSPVIQTHDLLIRGHVLYRCATTAIQKKNNIHTASCQGQGKLSERLITLISVFNEEYLGNKQKVLISCSSNRSNIWRILLILWRRLLRILEWNQLRNELKAYSYRTVSDIFDLVMIKVMKEELGILIPGSFLFVTSCQVMQFGMSLSSRW